jgi:diguanylate cyclase (GGDEF)-like protein
MSILAAEDNPVFQTLLRNLLIKWGYDVLTVREGNEAWRLLQAADAPRMAILDWMMPGMDGVEVCRRIRCAGREPYQYILLLTGRTESQDLVEGMEAGADDYLTKPFNAQELRVRLRAGRRILELQEELVLAREALREQAMHDGMTGVLNHTAVLEALRNEAERASREGHPLSLLLADFDHFKRINDTYGHLAGDAVLREAASRMKSVIRRYDALGRYGGEEFLVALPGCDAAAAHAQACRVRDAIAAELFCAGDAMLRVTVSVGATSRTHPSVSQVEALIREADLALYKAKREGRDRVESYRVESCGIPGSAAATAPAPAA